MVLYPKAQAELDAIQPEAATDIDAHRAAARAEAAAEDRAGVEYVRDVDADGVPCRLYRPLPRAPVVVYVHGGGWVYGDVDTTDRFARYFAVTSGWAVLSVDYRRAPEHPHPAPLDDVETAIGWVREHGAVHDVDASVVAGVGDSSGANLIAGLTVRNPAAVEMQVLAYPPLDPAGTSGSYVSEDIASLTAEEMRWYWHSYAPTQQLRENPEVAPPRAADVSGMPPTYLVVAEHDVLRDEGEAYAGRLARAGVPVVAQRCLGMTHGFWRHPWDHAAAESSIDQIVSALHRLLSD